MARVISSRLVTHGDTADSSHLSACHRQPSVGKGENFCVLAYRALGSSECSHLCKFSGRGMPLKVRTFGGCARPYSQNRDLSGPKGEKNRRGKKASVRSEVPKVLTFRSVDGRKVRTSGTCSTSVESSHLWPGDHGALRCFSSQEKKDLRTMTAASPFLSYSTATYFDASVLRQWVR